MHLRWQQLLTTNAIMNVLLLIGLGTLHLTFGFAFVSSR